MLKHAERLGKMLAGATTTKPKTTTPKIPGTIISEEQSKGYVFFHIKPFKDNDHGVNHRDTISKNIISLKKNKIIFMISGNITDIKMYVGVPKDFKSYFENTFYTSYPTSDLQEIKDPLSIPQKRERLQFDKEGTLLTKEEFTRGGTYMDPMNGIFSLYNMVDQNSKLDIYFTYTFKLEKNFFQYMNTVFKWIREPKKKNPDGTPIEKPIADKPEIFGSFSYRIITKDHYIRENLKKNIVAVFAPFISNGKIKIKTSEKFHGMMHNQAVNFFHIPTMENFVKGLEYTLYRKLPYPTNMPTTKNTDPQTLTILGNTDYRGEKITFGIREEDKFRHMYIVGKTGTGKSTFIENLLKSDMAAGNGLALLDPHGELVDNILEHIPTHRINDVILFDVGDTDYPIGFNLLQGATEEEKNLIASGVVSTFKKLFDSRGPRLEYILRNVALSLVDYPNATLMHILRMLIDDNFRTEVMSYIKDAVVLKFRTTEFNKRQPKQREEAIGPITNKVGQFLSSKLVRNIFGQPRTKLNLRNAMDEGKILLVNLSKGKIGEDNANMIGSLLVTKFQIDAMSRANIAAHLRRPFYLYIDEFQNFASESFATILSEARKYKLALIVANQYTAQLDEKTKDAIFGNVGTTVAFTLGKDDADIITGQFKGMASVNDLISLPKYTTYTRLMIDGISSDPFSMKTLPPIKLGEGSLELIDKVRKQSRQRYAMERGQLEKLMAARSNKTFSLQEKIMEKAKLESLGVTEEEVENLHDIFVEQHASYFTEFAIDGEEPDAIIFDTEYYSHKAVRYSKPKGLEDQANLKYEIGGKVSFGKETEIPVHVDIYQHQTIMIENNGPLMIRIGKKERALEQLNDIYKQAGVKNQSYFKFCPNIAKIEKTKGVATPKPSAPTTVKMEPVVKTPAYEGEIIHDDGTFSIKDIRLGKEYDGYIKLMYNYGMFVTVKGVEGLLHKNFIVAPAGVERKKYYNIGDKIKVKAKEFKDVNGEQKVVRAQK